LMLPCPIEQIELHRRAAEADGEASEALDPAAQGEAEGQVRIESTRDVARRKEAQIPRLDGAPAVSGSSSLERSSVGRLGTREEVVEDRRQGLLRHPLALDRLVGEEVPVAQRTRKPVAQAHDVQEAVVEHPPLDGAEGIERALPAFLDGIDREVGRQRAERGRLPLAALVDVLRLERAALREQLRFSLDDLPLQILP